MTERRQAILLFLIFVIGIAIAAFLYFQGNSGSEESPSPVITSSTIGGPFTLVDQYGKIVTQDDYKDKYNLIFFGFTHCPGICPGELQKMAAILDDLGPLSEQIQPLFISIDPQRDTPDAMRDYVENFHERLVGLTGTPEQIEQVKKDYKVYASKVENEMMGEGNYMMDHATFMYLMGKDDNLMLIFDMKDTVPEIVAEIKSAL